MTLPTPSHSTTDWAAANALQDRIERTLRNKSMLSKGEASHGFELTLHGPGVPEEGAIEVRYINYNIHDVHMQEKVALIHMINYMNALLDEGLTSARVRLHAGGDMYVLVKL